MAALPPTTVGPVDLAILGVYLPESRKRVLPALRRLQPRYILPSHQDDFFRPLTDGFQFGPMTKFNEVLVSVGKYQADSDRPTRRHPLDHAMDTEVIGPEKAFKGETRGSARRIRRLHWRSRSHRKESRSTQEGVWRGIGIAVWCRWPDSDRSMLSRRRCYRVYKRSEEICRKRGWEVLQGKAHRIEQPPINSCRTGCPTTALIVGSHCAGRHNGQKTAIARSVFPNFQLLRISQCAAWPACALERSDRMSHRE